MSWKIYVDSPQKRALDSCYGSFAKGDGGGCGVDYAAEFGDGYGVGYLSGAGAGVTINGDGFGYGHDNFALRGDGRSSNKW